MSTSSTTSSSSRGSEFECKNVKKRRKMEDYFESFLREVLVKQESLQNKLIDAIERCENERLAREKEWRMQELARVTKEHDVLAQERAINAAKDAALLAFLQKVSGEQVIIAPLQIVPDSKPIPPSQEEPSTLLNHHQGCRGGAGDGVASCRWPKPEVEDLIRLRSNMELQYHQDHNGPKGGSSLWEEVSSAMKKLGYDRSAKRCKEKWENINKYFKRVKASNNKRPQDSKTCPYFEQLESIYQKKRQLGKVESSTNSDSSGCSLKPQDVSMQMIGQQEQEQDQRLLLATETRENTNVV